jgi:hypothetical protein
LIAGALWDDGRFDAAGVELAAGLAGVPPGVRERTELRLQRIRLMGRLAHVDDLEAEAEALLAEVAADDPTAAAALHLARGDMAIWRSSAATCRRLWSTPSGRCSPPGRRTRR